MPPPDGPDHLLRPRAGPLKPPAGGSIPKISHHAALGDRFVRGILFYPGKEELPFGPKLRAMPINRLGTGEARREA